VVEDEFHFYVLFCYGLIFCSFFFIYFFFIYFFIDPVVSKYTENIMFVLLTFRRKGLRNHYMTLIRSIILFLHVVPSPYLVHLSSSRFNYFNFIIISQILLPMFWLTMPLFPFPFVVNMYSLCLKPINRKKYCFTHIITCVTGNKNSSQTTSADQNQAAHLLYDHRLHFFAM
jgi:hypothetical protein